VTFIYNFFIYSKWVFEGIKLYLYGSVFQHVYLYGRGCIFLITFHILFARIYTGEDVRQAGNTDLLFILQEQLRKAFGHTWGTGNMMYVNRSSTVELRVCFLSESEDKRKVKGA
jgi:hypothetical protein